MNDILQQADEIRSEAEKSSKQYSETRDALQKKARDAWDNTTDLVRRHPAKALGIAIGTGIALGALAVALANRRNDSPASRLRNLADDGVDTWDKVSGGFNEAIGTLKEAVNHAVSKFK